MRAVNLLPEKHRPRQHSGGGGQGAYILLGVLGVIVAGVLMYVVTVNSINSDKTAVAAAQADTTQANARAEQLGAYGDFAQVKNQRYAEVKGLALGRMDWERLVRELAHVLPDDVWIQNASAADAGADATGGATPAPTTGSTAAPAAGTDPAAAGPTLTLQGCARDQAQVAEMLVRLRELQGSSDVKLDHSTQGEEAAAGDSAASAGNCGEIDGAPNYQFQVSVTFEKPSGDARDGGNVPARLGGGQ